MFFTRDPSLISDRRGWSQKSGKNSLAFDPGIPTDSVPARNDLVMRSEPDRGSTTTRIEPRPIRALPFLMAMAAGLAVVLTLDGPGLTIDEPLDVRPGRTYLELLRATGWQFFDSDVVDRAFRDNAEHPPLGRWLLGIASVMGEPFEVLWKGADPTGGYVLAGRLAPAIAFAASWD